MTWERIVKGSHIMRHGPLWHQQPRISIGKTGVSFSPAFCRTFGIVEKIAVAVLIDRKNIRVGFKVCTEEERERGEGFSVQGKGDSGCYIACPRIGEAFPAQATAKGGKSYPARLNPGERVIVADLLEEEVLA